MKTNTAFNYPFTEYKSNTYTIEQIQQIVVMGMFSKETVSLKIPAYFFGGGGGHH